MNMRVRFSPGPLCPCSSKVEQEAFNFSVTVRFCPGAIIKGCTMKENDGTIVGVCVVASLIVGSVFVMMKLLEKPRK